MTTEPEWCATRVPKHLMKRVINSIDGIMCSALPRERVIAILKSTDPKDVQFYRAMAAGAIKAAMIFGQGPFDVGFLRILDFDIDESIGDFVEITGIGVGPNCNHVFIDFEGGRRVIVAREEVVNGVKS